MPLSADPSDDEIFTCVEIWIDHLADANFEAAYACTEHDAYYAWTPSLLKRVIEGYGFPESRQDGRVFHVTPRSTAIGRPPTREIDREGSSRNVIARVCYDLPLNGGWSDLTATFRVESLCNGSTLVLEEVHVF